MQYVRSILQISAVNSAQFMRGRLDLGEDPPAILRTGKKCQANISKTLFSALKPTLESCLSGCNAKSTSID